MPKFSRTSLERLHTCHIDLRRLFVEVVTHFDCTVCCGYRTEAEQSAAYPKYSSVKWPDSKHNAWPSLAVDVVPYPVDWNDWRKFRVFGGFVLGVASQLGIDVRWGHDWDRDHDFHDQTFIDAPHFELLPARRVQA